MLNTEKLFKIHPFIFKIEDEYYAFGAGVCTKFTDENKNKKKVKEKYSAYESALQNENIKFDEAWRVFYSLNSIAEEAKNYSEHIHLKEIFESYNFNEKERLALQKQLDSLVIFFKTNELFVNK